MLSRTPRLRAAVRGFKRRARAPVLRGLRSLAWYRRLSHLPRNEIVSCREYARRFAGSGASLVEIHPASRLEQAPEPGGPFASIRALEFPATFVARLPGCRLYGRGVAVVGEDGSVLEEASVHIGGATSEHALFGRAWLPRPVPVEGTTAVLAAPAGNTYYHWLFDVLPRIELLRLAGVGLAGIDRFAVNSCGRPYQIETLARLGIDARRVIETDRLRHVRCAAMVFPSYPGTSGTPPPWACELLRRTFPEAAAAEAGSGSARIYVGRRRGGTRRVENEADLEAVLRREGFELLFAEDHTVAEQARLFGRARLIVAPHGSALANLVFCASGARVVELFPPDMAGQSHYFVLARLRGLRHEALIGTPGRTSGDFVVEPEALAALVKT